MRVKILKNLKDKRHTRHRDGSPVPPFPIKCVLLILVLLAGFGGAVHAISVALPGRNESCPRSDIAPRIVSLLQSLRPPDAGLYGLPEKLMGGLLDIYVDVKPADEGRIESFADFAAARIRGVPLSKMTPEETSRRLYALADEAELELHNPDTSGSPPTYRITLEGLMLFARYYARKILAGASLALFYESNDAAFLRTATSHAVADLEIWERLVRFADAKDLPVEIFGQADAVAWNGSLVLVRHDVQRLQEARKHLERYGLFDLGFDFGPRIKPAHNPYGLLYARAFSLERRFSPLDPEMTYSPKRGYGWLDCRGITASAPVPLADPTLSGGLLTDPTPPSDAHPSGFLRGRNKSTLQVDMPDGDFRVTSVISNQPEVAMGSFQIRASAEGKAPAEAITYPAGETGDKSMNVRVRNGKLVLEFVPERGEDWLVNRLIIARRNPHIGHVPIFAAAAGATTTVSATITAPEGIARADLHLSINNRMLTVPMLPDTLEFSARIDWPPAWVRSEVAYFISAQDTAGHAGRWPATGAVRIHISE